MAKIYFIGGSPCSGKSTVAEALASKYGLYYFKVDDFLEKYTKQGAHKGCEICKKQLEWNLEQIWMREPTLQCKEELQFYEEIFEFIIADLKDFGEARSIITEGAAYLPHLIKRLNISKNQYISITPTRDFQISNYKERDWIHIFLEGCSNREKAFDNWMERDCLFAECVIESCLKQDYVSIINDGHKSISEMIANVSAHFGLE